MKVPQMGSEILSVRTLMLFQVQAGAIPEHFGHPADILMPVQSVF